MNAKNESCPQCGGFTAHPGQRCSNCSAEKRDAFMGGNTNSTVQAPDKSQWVIVLLLCWFLGYLGIHRFYTGHIGIGLIQLLTFGGCGIWFLIDFIMIVTGNFRDAAGNRLHN
jgi:TM2 domain-containing membrane protein YozV